MTDKLKNAFYLHCRKCIKESRGQAIEVSTAGVRIQVWCRRHGEEVATLTLARPLSAVCEGPGHKETPS